MADDDGYAGPVKMPGRLGDGRRATFRSEDAEYERARREAEENQPSSLMGRILDPQGSSLKDSIRKRAQKRMELAGPQVPRTRLGDM